jgi:biotin transport system substrate-specific component
MYGTGGYAHYKDKVAGDLYQWRNEATFTEKMAVALLFALLTALASMIRLYVPFTPVPFTGQVLVVLMSAVVLGRFGAVSQVMYLAIGGSFGLFTTGGFMALVGVTGGYLFGFVAAAALLGALVERKREWSYLSVAVAMAAAVGVIYLFGVGQLMLALDLGLWQGITLGAAPFVAADALKIVLGIGMASFLLPIRK